MNQYLRPKKRRVTDTVLRRTGIAVLCLLLVAVASFVAAFFVTMPKAPAAAPPASGIARPVPLTRSILLLFTRTQQSADASGGNPVTLPCALFLVRPDYGAGAITLSAVPLTLRCTVGNRTDSLAGLYTYGDFPLLKEGFEQALNITPDRYAVIPITGGATVIDQLGGVGCDVPQTIPGGDVSAGEVPVSAGSQTLTGAMAMAALLYTGWSGGETQRLSVQQGILAALINQNAVADTLPKMAGLFALFSNNSRGNLSFEDFAADFPAMSAFTASSPVREVAFPQDAGDAAALCAFAKNFGAS